MLRNPEKKKSLLTSQYKGLMLKWPHIVWKSLLNPCLSFLIILLLLRLISYHDSMWPLTSLSILEDVANDTSWGSDDVGGCPEWVWEKVTWKGNIPQQSELNRATNTVITSAGKTLINTMCSTQPARLNCLQTTLSHLPLSSEVFYLCWFTGW